MGSSWLNLELKFFQIKDFFAKILTTTNAEDTVFFMHLHSVLRFDLQYFCTSTTGLS